MFSFSNPVYAAADNSLIDVMAVLVEGMPAIPYTASKNDPATAAIYAEILAAGSVGAYVAPPAPTLAQQAAALIAGGLTITSTSTPALN
ncbi:MAG: hypothetical protein B7Z77_11565, partial [Acidocella sp. 20-58-15]